MQIEARSLGYGWVSRGGASLHLQARWPTRTQSVKSPLASCLPLPYPREVCKTLLTIQGGPSVVRFKIGSPPCQQSGRPGILRPASPGRHGTDTPHSGLLPARERPVATLRPRGTRNQDVERNSELTRPDRKAQAIRINGFLWQNHSELGCSSNAGCRRGPGPARLPEAGQCHGRAP